MELIDFRKKDILIPVKSPTDGLDDATIKAETEYSISFTEQEILYVWVYITMKATVFLLMG